MKSFVIIIFSLISGLNFSYTTDQEPDILIIDNDTIYLKSFPLEYLQFQSRPFTYGRYDFPNPKNYRGYQATWKVVGKKLFLTEITKADGTDEKVDPVIYFAQNEYSPTIIDGYIFADWFSADLGCFPRDYKKWGCDFRSYNPRKYKPAIKFESGMMKFNNYKSPR